MRAAGRDVLGIHADITRQEDVDRLLAQTLGPFRAARRAGEQRRPLDARQGARHHAGTVPRLDGTEPDRPGALHAGGRAALAPAARARGQHRLAGGQIGRPLGRRVSGHEVRRGGLLAAVAAGAWGRKGCTSCWSVPVPSSARTPACIRWRDWKTCPSRPGAPGAGVQVRAIPPQDLARAILRACQRRRPELVVPGQGPAAVRPGPALAELGRLDRAAEERVVKGQMSQRTSADCGRRGRCYARQPPLPAA